MSNHWNHIQLPDKPCMHCLKEQIDILERMLLQIQKSLDQALIKEIKEE